jgi:hypothetical protein
MGRSGRCAVVVAIGLVLAPSVHGHVDPPGCSASGVGLSIGMYRGDATQGLTPAASECERTFYRVTLQKADPSTCAVSGGRLTLTTPDGATHTVADPVPCVGAAGGPGSPCTIATPAFASATVSYAVRAADAQNGILTATARYEGGIIHDGDRDTAGLVVSAQRRAEIIVCDDGDPTTTDVCDPTAAGAAACSHSAAAPTPLESACAFSPFEPTDLLACTPRACRVTGRDD